MSSYIEAIMGTYISMRYISFESKSLIYLAGYNTLKEEVT